MTNNPYILDIRWTGGTTTTQGLPTEEAAVEQRKYLLMMDRAKSVTIWRVTGAEKVEVEKRTAVVA